MSDFNPDTTRIGWIGTGVMGGGMCRNLITAGYDVTVYSRTQSKSKPLIDSGATWADSPAAVARCSDVVFSIVGLPHDVREVALGPKGVIENAAAGAVYIDMTTSEPELAKEIYDVGKQRSIACLDAPVSGGDVGAKSGSLSIMVGGDRSVFEMLNPCFEAMGTTIVYQGTAGCGQHAKMVNQILVAAGMVGVCEALLYARQSNLNLDAVLASVSSGAAGSWALTHMAPRIIAGDFQPGFFVDHFVKDLGIAIAGAKALNLDLPGLALAAQLYRRLQDHGGGGSGTQALQKTLAEMSGLRWS
jgi:3-hydroxyisobutyrate dehydrogenase